MQGQHVVDFPAGVLEPPASSVIPLALDTDCDEVISPCMWSWLLESGKVDMPPAWVDIGYAISRARKIW